MWYQEHIWWVLALMVFVDCAHLAEVDNEASITHNNYSFAFETENGQVRDESIELDTESNPRSLESESDLNVKGSYSFISADGYEYSVYYKAGKNGYQPYVTAHKIKTDAKKTD